MLRGGAWNNQPQNVQCAIRNNNNPDNRNNNIGFRCAKTPGQIANSKEQKEKSKKKQESPGLFSRNPAAYELPACGTTGVHGVCPAFRNSGTKHKIARRRLVATTFGANATAGHLIVAQHLCCATSFLNMNVEPRRMAQKENILTRVEDFIVWFLPHLEHFPRDYKYLIGDRAVASRVSG